MIGAERCDSRLVIGTRRESGIGLRGCCCAARGLLHHDFGCDHLVSHLVVVNGDGQAGFDRLTGDRVAVFIHIRGGLRGGVADRGGGGRGFDDDGVRAELAYRTS